MDEPSKSERSCSATRMLLSVGLALLVVGSLAGHAVGSPGVADVTTPRADALDAHAEQDGVDVRTEQNSVDLEVDCNESAVRVTAPASFEYTLRVSSVVVTPSSSEVFTTTTTESGNATANLTEGGPAYAFVSSDDGLVASAFQNCALSAGPDAPTVTTRAPEPGVASAEIDCNAGEVRVTAPSDYAYNLRVSNVVATPQSTEVFTTSMTASGNATVPVGDAGAVAAFVSNETGTVASAFENCEFDDEA